MRDKAAVFQGLWTVPSWFSVAAADYLSNSMFHGYGGLGSRPSDQSAKRFVEPELFDYGPDLTHRDLVSRTIGRQLFEDRHHSLLKALCSAVSNAIVNVTTLVGNHLCHATQCRVFDVQVDSGSCHRRMSQLLGYVVERHAVRKHSSSKAVPQNMGAYGF